MGYARSNLQILRDAARRPVLFHWFGAMSSLEIDDWFRASGLTRDQVPLDLPALWAATGGGDFFESETLLGPLGSPALGDDVLSVNRGLWEQGMPRRYLVISRGAYAVAVDMPSGRYLELSQDSWRPLATYTSFDEWYARGPRHEFAARYGLGTEES